MRNRPGISGDIRPASPKPISHRGEVPLPAGMPRRNHRVPPRQIPPVSASSGRKLKLWELAQYPLVAAVALTAASNSTLGQIYVLMYAGVVLVRHLPSKQVFGLSLVLLLSVPLFQALGQSGISENAAIYVYELLVVGTIGAILELNQSGHEVPDITLGSHH